WQSLPGAQGWGSENVSSSSVSDAGTVPVTARPLGASCSRVSTFERQPSCLPLLQPAPATRSRRPVPWESSCSVVARHPQVPQKPAQPGSGEAVEMMWTSEMKSQDSLWMHSTSGDVETSVHWCNCTTMRQAGWRCGVTRAPNASAMGCQVRARFALAGRSCLRSAKWAQGCWNASTAPRASWAPTTAKPCCPQSARSSLPAEPTSSTPPTRPTSVPPIGAPARQARAAAPATAVPRTSAAATCCAAVADTARRVYSSRRTACAASTGAAWCSATAAACARNSACASDPPPACLLTARSPLDNLRDHWIPAGGAVCAQLLPRKNTYLGLEKLGSLRFTRAYEGLRTLALQHSPEGSSVFFFFFFCRRLCRLSLPLASQMEIKKSDSGLWRPYSSELLGWLGKFSINKDI
ncbi:hypothetical protein LEMLEM_LOCUS18667, partial [Lemmus lemmus]